MQYFTFMATEAKVRSVDALESLRASLIIFGTRARRAIDQVGEEVSRTRQWGEQVSILYRGPPSRWVGPVYACAVSISIFGFVCAARLWARDRIGGRC